MDTIRDYLNNVFASLPDTEQVRRLKNDMLADMTAKYHELKRQGKSENEAIGVVIGEFGSIDEIVDGLGISRADGGDGQDVDGSCKSGNRELAMFSAVYWPAVFLLWLASGFLFSAWKYSWLIYISAGVVFSAVSGILSLRKKKDKGRE